MNNNTYNEPGLSREASIGFTGIVTSMSVTISTFTSQSLGAMVGRVTSVGIGLVDVIDAVQHGTRRDVTVQTAGLASALLSAEAGVAIGVPLGTAFGGWVGGIVVGVGLGGVAAYYGEDYVQAGVAALLDSDFYQFDSFDPWGHPLHRVDEDGVPQYGPSYTSQRDENNVPWGLDTPTERQGHQPGAGKPSFVSPNMSPNRLGGAISSSRPDGSLSSSPEASPSQRSGARDAAPESNRSNSNRSDALGSLSSSPEASPSQRAGARDAASSTRSSGSISGSVGITDHQRSSVWGGTTSTPRGSPGSLASSPEASPSQRAGARSLVSEFSYQQDFGYSGSANSGSHTSSAAASSYSEPMATDRSPGAGGRGGSSGKSPVLFDLNGDGISITERDNSTQYFNIGGDGYDHRTAWAGVGDGVLVFDADGDGKISSKKEVVFTDWDPSAGSDMEALRQVFDTNQNGLLDAGDAEWASFRIMVTQADGSTVLVKPHAASRRLSPHRYIRRNPVSGAVADMRERRYCNATTL